MPLDVKDAMLTAGLNNPTPPPPQPGSNFQAISGVNPSMNYGMPFGTGATIATAGATAPVNNFNPGGFQGVTPGTTLARDFNEVGGNVAGLYGRDYSPEDTKAFIPEAKDPTEEQTNEFLKAYEEGYTVEEGRRENLIDMGVTGVEQKYDSLSDKNKERLGKLGIDAEKIEGLGRIGQSLKRSGGQNDMRSARLAKREDRYSDKKARRAAFDAAREAGASRGEARRMKREMRRGARASRKDAWKTFKGERDLQRQEEAYKLEQKYS